MKLLYKNGLTSIILRIKILDTSVTTGAGKTGLTSSSSGLIISTIADNEATATAYTVAGSTIETITTLGTFAAPTATKCRFKEVDATNHPGLYEIQIADARWAVSNARSIIVTVSGVSGAAQVDAEIQLPAFDLQTAVQSVDVTKWNNSTVATPDTAGYPKVTNKVGTGTGELNLSSGVIQSDVAKWLGTAVSTPNVAGVPDVNTKTWNNLTTVALPLIPTISGRTLDVSATGEAGLDWGNVGSPTTTVGFTNTTIGILTTYTGNTPQTGDSYGRIGLAGVGLTNIGDARMANLDALVSSRLATVAYTAPLTAAGTRTALGLATANMDTQFAADLAAIAALNNFNPATQYVILATSQPNYAPSKAGDAMALTSGERTATANEVEAQIIDDTDSEKVLEAITNKIAAVNPSLAGLTLSAIAIAARTEMDSNSTKLIAINAKTTNLPSDPADASDIATAFTAMRGADNDTLKTLSDQLDPVGTGVIAINAKTTNLPSDPADASDIAAAIAAVRGADNDDLQTLSIQLDGVNSKTTNLPSDPADQSLVMAAIAAVDAKTTNLPSDPADQSLIMAAIAAIPGGGDATEAKQDAIIADLVLIKGSGFSTTTDSLKVISDSVDGINAGTGTGSFILTYTVTDEDDDPISDCIVEARLSNNEAASKVASGRTDLNGVITLRFEATGTVYLWLTKEGIIFTNPDTEVVA